MLERTPESRLDSKGINQSILREINPEHSFEGLMPKLKFQYFDHLMQTANSLEKPLMLGKTEGRRLDGIPSATDMNHGRPREMRGTARPGTRQSLGVAQS